MEERKVLFPFDSGPLQGSPAEDPVEITCRCRHLAPPDTGYGSIELKAGDHCLTEFGTLRLTTQPPQQSIETSDGPSNYCPLENC
ncbi:hypothetical protein J6590_057454 [Homalodisca vitripennis]|nr:hypothetical protein J6590_057454 [Homalodisca vitripennis]